MHLTLVGSAVRSVLGPVLLCALVLTVPPAHGQTETVLYGFAGSPDGGGPGAALIRDKEGNLYGTTLAGGVYNACYGGSSGCGTVFKLTPSGTETILWSFGNGKDGSSPSGSFIFDKGNLYSTTRYGGAYNGGTVFKLTPSGTETILWSFGNGADGYNPYAGLVVDKLGNLYGTTSAGGATSCYNGCGTVFRLTPSGTETVLYSFGSQSGDGYFPLAGLTMDAKGNLYGTTLAGGAYNQGTVFKLTPSGTETILWSFGNEWDGAWPNGGLVFDHKGNLYGMTAALTTEAQCLS